MKRIGLLGCGVVGQHLGVRILHAGFELRVHDRHREKADKLLARGATWTTSPAALGSDCDVVVSALPGAEDVLSALLSPDGVWSSAPPGTLHVDTSTIGVACARTLAAEATKLRIRYLDAPLSAAAAIDSGPSLTLFVAGNADHYDLAKSLLQAMAENVHFFGGPPGNGQVVKLVNNLASHCMTIVLADALAMGLKAGLSIDLLRAALHDGIAQCRLLDELLPATAFRGDWRPGLRLDLAIKDLALAQELASAMAVELHLVPEVRSIYEEAQRKGWGDLSSHAVLRLQEEAAAVSFRSSIFERLRPPDDVARDGDDQPPTDKPR
jgi:3-hydroxyisobutyrate dehydrogenase